MTERMRNILDGLQACLAGELAAARAANIHPVAKGDASEGAWLNLLKKHLPERYNAAKGFAIDHTGQCSDAIDILIFDRQYTPLIYNLQDQLFVPAEAVYAAIEVKQDLSAEHIKYAGEKVESVRNLERTSARIYTASGTVDPRALFKILGAILTHHSKWTPPFGDPFRESLKQLGEAQQIDLGCALEHGAFEASYPDTGTVSKVFEGPRTLVHFLWRLIWRLQSVATVPAIEYEKYLAGI
jgi:hypothetical protein